MKSGASVTRARARAAVRPRAPARAAARQVAGPTARAPERGRPPARRGCAARGRGGRGRGSARRVRLRPPPAGSAIEPGPRSATPAWEGWCAVTIAILDIDGTLVDTNYQHAIAWYRAFRQHD